MKKLLLLLLIFVTTVTLNAQVFTEYFETATTGMNLEDYNDWYVSPKAAEAYGVSPIIDEETLFFDGYIGGDIGKVVILDSLVGKDATTQRMSSKLVTFGQDTLKPGTSGKMYYAVLANILPNSYHSFRDFMLWEGSTTSSFNRGRVFAKVSDDNMDLQFAVSKNSASSGVYVESEVFPGGVGLTYLLVLSYEVVDGDANDIVSLYINPDPTKSEAEQTAPLVATDAQSDFSATQIMKINVRQRGVAAQIGGIRVGRTWEHVLKGEPALVTGVTLDKETLSLTAGTTGTLVATVSPADAADPTLVWSSNNEAAATVADGVVSAVAPGEATITVTTNDGSFTANCVVTVNAAVTGVSLDKETLSLTAGTTGTLIATVTPAGTALIWSSNNEAAATVADGVVSAVAPGEATITVTTIEGSFTASCVVTVSVGVKVADVETTGYSLYPNPVSGGVLYVKLSEINKPKSFEIYNMLGVLVHREKTDNKSIVEVNTSSLLAKGVYFVKINNNSGSHIEQIIIQ